MVAIAVLKGIAQNGKGRAGQIFGCGDTLQDDGAMMDWIAVPNFLDAYR